MKRAKNKELWSSKINTNFSFSPTRNLNWKFLFSTINYWKIYHNATEIVKLFPRFSFWTKQNWPYFALLSKPMMIKNQHFPEIPVFFHSRLEQTTRFFYNKIGWCEGKSVSALNIAECLDKTRKYTERNKKMVSFFIVLSYRKNISFYYVGIEEV